MASINYGAREISVKIVYYGPGLSGKTTNLQVIHRKIPIEHKSDMVSLATETDRTLFFDFLPLDLGTIKGFSTKFQLYTVPGQVYYNATRKLVLRGVDGVVFVADSAQDKIQENLESFQNLEDNLAEYHYKREEVPIILQYNKRDIPNALSIEELEQQVNRSNLPWTEAVANKGIGVFDSLKLIGKIVIDNLNKKYSRLSRGVTSAPVGAPSARMTQGIGTPASAGGYDARYQGQVPPSAPSRQQPYASFPPQVYAPAAAAVHPQQPSVPQPVIPSQSAKSPLQRPTAMYPTQGQQPPHVHQTDSYTAPASYSSKGGYPYQQSTPPQEEVFPPPPPQSGYPDRPEREKAAAISNDGQQQYGFVNFEPLPIEPGKPPQTIRKNRPLGPQVADDAEKKASAPVDPKEKSQHAPEEKSPSALQKQKSGGEQPQRGNEQTVVFPQKQQRPARTKIDERDYNVYHVDSSPKSFPLESCPF